MAAFSSLTDRLSNAFKHLKSKGKLSEADIDGTIREIRRALLDADVALDVVRSFTSRIDFHSVLMQLRKMMESRL